MAGSTASDEIYGGGGNDTLFGAPYNAPPTGAGRWADPKVLVPASDSGDDLLEGGSGADAIYGLDGRDSLITQAHTNYTSYCGTGAFVISSGLDENANGSLEYGEITHTSYLCDAVDGANALVETYVYNGGECFDGGVLIRTGTDFNGNGYLDSSEYDETILCN